MGLDEVTDGAFLTNVSDDRLKMVSRRAPDGEMPPDGLQDGFLRAGCLLDELQEAYDHRNGADDDDDDNDNPSS